MQFRPLRSMRGYYRVRLLTPIALVLLCTAFAGVWLARRLPLTRN